jgi:hypothetical protein
MVAHWAEVEDVMKTLMMKLKGVDDNGVDVHVTGNQESVPQTNEFTKVQKAIERTAPPGQIEIDIPAALGRIFNHYYTKQAENRRTHRALRRMTLYVLTDGIWDGTLDVDNLVDEKIASFIRKVAKVFEEDFSVRPCTIQFIQFGNDPKATQRLRRLDDDLPAMANIP